MKDDTPDYSRYTLDDLHDVARRVNKERYSDRYALIVQELERREPKQRAAPGASEPQTHQPLELLALYLRFFGSGGPVYYAVTYLGTMFFPGATVTFVFAFFLALGAGIYCACFWKRESTPLTTGGFLTLFLTAAIYFCGGALFTWSVSLGVLFLLLPATGDVVQDIPNFLMRISYVPLTTGVGGVVMLGFWLRQQKW